MAKIAPQDRASFKAHVHNDLILPFERDCIDIIVAIRNGDFDSHAQELRFMKYIQRHNHADIIAALYFVTQAPQGSVMYTWGEQRLKDRIRSMYLRSDPQAELFTDYILHFVNKPTSRTSLYAAFWHQAQQNHTLGSQLHRWYNKVKKCLRLEMS